MAKYNRPLVVFKASNDRVKIYARMCRDIITKRQGLVYHHAKGDGHYDFFAIHDSRNVSITDATIRDDAPGWFDAVSVQRK